MSAKKLSRIVISAFVVAVLLAVSAMAYSLTLDGTLNGLESGTEYTAAMYNFETNAYGEFTELTPICKVMIRAS